jgi:AcrR family transcriptional regulator
MPRAGLDTTTIVRAAAATLNSEGVEALTLNRLAQELGVKTPSLYNHIDGLPGLYRELALRNARTLGERFTQAAIGKSGPAAIMAVAQAYRAYIKESPGVYLASLRSSGTQQFPDAELSAAEEQSLRVAVAVVASFGLTGDDALHAVRGLRSLVHGFATLEIAGGFGLPLDLDESFDRLLQMLVRALQTAGDPP